MSIFSKLFARFKPKTIPNQYFGNLLWMNIPKSPNGGYFEGARDFRGRKIEVFIDGKIGDTLAEQSEMFLSIEKNYDDLVAKGFPLVRKELLQFDFDLDKSTFEKEFRFVSLSLEERVNGIMEWDMGFEGTKSIFHITIFFKESTPVLVAIDT